MNQLHWESWGTGRDWATGFVDLLGPGAEAHQSGGNVWVVLYQNPDGRFVVFGDCGGEVYPCREDYEEGEDCTTTGIEFSYDHGV